MLHSSISNVFSTTMGQFAHGLKLIVPIALIYSIFVGGGLVGGLMFLYESPKVVLTATGYEISGGNAQFFLDIFSYWWGLIVSLFAVTVMVYSYGVFLRAEKPTMGDGLDLIVTGVMQWGRLIPVLLSLGAVTLLFSYIQMLLGPAGPIFQLVVLVLQVYLFVTIPLALVEKTPHIKALWKSMDFISGFWFKTLGHMLLMGVLLLLFMGVTVYVTIGGILFGIMEDLALGQFLVSGFMTQSMGLFFVFFVLSFIIMAFFQMYTMNYYLLLKKDKAAGHITDFKTIS